MSRISWWMLQQAYARSPLFRRGLHLLTDQRGQAMVEYSTITYLILIGTIGFGFGMPLSSVGISQFGIKTTLAQALYKALQTYVDSVNFSLSLAAT